MKQNTNNILEVKIEVESFQTIEKILFIFKQYEDIDSVALKKCWYNPGDVNSACSLVVGKTDTVAVPFSAAETMLFKGDEDFYMDTKIFITGSLQNPGTKIVKLKMEKSLIKPSDEAVNT